MSVRPAQGAESFSRRWVYSMAEYYAASDGEVPRDNALERSAKWKGAAGAFDILAPAALAMPMIQTARCGR